jgi:hypothetical protein
MYEIKNGQSQSSNSNLGEIIIKYKKSMTKPHLLCTFSNFENYEADLEEIRNFYTIVFDKIFILQNMDDKYELLLTYNIEPMSGGGFLPRTISVHRKKETNTIYTINALNEVVKSLNNGEEDPTFEIDWREFRNSLILTDDEEGYKVISTKLFDIV